MRHPALLLALGSMLVASVALAAEDPPPTPPPAQVKALAGCWSGKGTVMGKPVAITLEARPAAGGAMLLVEAGSHAEADPADVYAAHLLFGGRAVRDGEPASIVGFWADSFGGDGASMGRGASTADGFEVAYPYGDAAFVNRWTVAQDKVAWSIVMRGVSGKEQDFARYELVTTACK